MSHLQLHGTFASNLRDSIQVLINEKKVTKQQVRERLHIPKEFHGDVLRMVQHNQYKRITDPVELIMEQNVHIQIIDKLLKDEHEKDI
jgi:hypothetical protein